MLSSKSNYLHLSTRAQPFFFFFSSAAGAWADYVKCMAASAKLHFSLTKQSCWWPKMTLLIMLFVDFQDNCGVFESYFHIPTIRRSSHSMWRSPIILTGNQNKLDKGAQKNFKATQSSSAKDKIIIDLTMANDTHNQDINWTWRWRYYCTLGLVVLPADPSQ